MKIIEKIKIRNFRSFLNIKNEISDLKDLNIFS
jgi:DNA repair exonuclease SbcCD ATPase subunit